MVAKAKEIYNTYCDLRKKTGKKPVKLKLTDRADDWCNQYWVLLWHPNKCFSISQNVQKKSYSFRKMYETQDTDGWQSTRWTHHFFQQTRSCCIKTNLHDTKTLHFWRKDQACFIKENHHLPPNVVQLWLLHRFHKSISSSFSQLVTPLVVFQTIFERRQHADCQLTILLKITEQA